MAPAAEPPTVLDALREKWAGRWHIWRARSWRDQPGERTGEYVATRITPDAGPYRTVMERTPADLDAALEWQRTPEAARSLYQPSEDTPPSEAAGA